MRCLRTVVLLLAAPLFPTLLAWPQGGEPKTEPAKDQVTKKTDGWFLVEFQVGTGKVKVEFPGEPKLESDSKLTGVRHYSHLAKDGRTYSLRITEGHEGKVLPEVEKDTLVSEGIVTQWRKDNPAYKNARMERRPFAGVQGMQIIIDMQKGSVGSYQNVVVSQGCLLHVSVSGVNLLTDATFKRFRDSVKIEKGEAAPITTTKVEVPAGWIEHTKGKLPVKVHAPIQLESNFRAVKGDKGEFSFFLKDGKTTEFRVGINWTDDPMVLEAFRGTANAMVPAKAAKVTLGGVPGICTFKDGKPIAANGKFGYYAIVDQFTISVNCNTDKVSAQNAEKVAALIVQQLRK